MLIPVEPTVDVQLRDELLIWPTVRISICGARRGRCRRVQLTCVLVHVQLWNELHASTWVQAESLSSIINSSDPLRVHETSCNALSLTLKTLKLFFFFCLPIELSFFNFSLFFFQIYGYLFIIWDVLWIVVILLTWSFIRFEMWYNRIITLSCGSLFCFKTFLCYLCFLCFNFSNLSNLS